jgi:hypothetical protein
MVQNCVHIYVSGKMVSVETISGRWGRRGEEEWWRGEFKHDMLDI